MLLWKIEQNIYYNWEEIEFVEIVKFTLLHYKIVTKTKLFSIFGIMKVKA